MFLRPKGRIFQVTELNGNSIVDVHEFQIPGFWGKKLKSKDIESSNQQFSKALPQNTVVVKLYKSNFVIHSINGSALAVRKGNGPTEILADARSVHVNAGDAVYMNVAGRVFSFAYADKVDDHVQPNRLPLLVLLLIGFGTLASQVWQPQMLAAKIAEMTNGQTVCADTFCSEDPVYPDIEVVEVIEDNVVQPERVEPESISSSKKTIKKKVSKNTSKKAPKNKKDAIEKLSKKSDSKLAGIKLAVLNSDHNKILNSFSTNNNAAEIKRTSLPTSTLQAGSTVSAVDSAIDNFNTEAYDGGFVVNRPKSSVGLTAATSTAELPKKQKVEQYPAQWDEQVKNRLPQARQCFDENSKLIEGRDAEYFMDVMVSSAGQVTAVKLSGGQMPNKIKRCISDRVRRWTLTPASPQDAKISVPIVLRNS
jgi:hypothetical protein